ncbi:hypothetical protein BW10_07245 [Bifidobacterium sp. UTBIF-56]|nr:hypothetical protein BW10_07245 [Bifidobacterium sp. UTBIF-56]
MKRFSSWENHFRNHSALFSTYGTYMLSGESLARMRFLLIIESLENHYDFLHKDEEAERESKFQTKREAALSFLKSMENSVSDEERVHIQFIKKNIYNSHRTSLQVKLKTLFSSLPNETIESIAGLETIHCYSENNNKAIDTVCAALVGIRNTFSHGNNEIYRNDFPYLVNRVEGIAQYLMLCEIGFGQDEVSDALNFHGFPPLKEIKLPL